MELHPRKKQILHAIIEHFVATAEPVGSQTIVVSYRMAVSPATIRNDMAELEAEGFIFQPHTSAGRVPTDTGYRHYVNELTNYDKAHKKAVSVLANIQKEYDREKTYEKLQRVVSLLARASENVSFATLPGEERTFYLGISHILRQPEFMQEPLRASQVVEVLEKGTNFLHTLKNLEIPANGPQIYIGKENILKEINSCSVIVAQYNFKGHQGFFGILGPTRMAYPFNLALVTEMQKMFNE